MYEHPRYWRLWDWWLTLFMLLVLAGGLVVMISAVKGFNPTGMPSFILKQAAAILLGLFLWVVLGFIDYASFRTLYWFLYAANLLLLGLVLAVGIEQNGSRSWLDLGLFQIQPSELSKVLLILTLGKQLEAAKRITSWIDLLPSIFHVLPVFGLVMLQGDLGTGLVLVVISLAMVYGAGFPGWKIAVLGISVLILSSCLVFSHLRWGTTFPLNPTQWERIETFLWPEYDPDGRGWQVIQSKVAIGSGGVWGKGFGKGTQNRLGYLPYQHTDFIFAVAAEEFGLAGGATILGLFCLIFFRIAIVAGQARERYGGLICVGVLALLGFHVLENIGMTLGVTPVTGIPLPFISYGPTAMLTNLAAVGLVQGVAVRRNSGPAASLLLLP